MGAFYNTIRAAALAAKAAAETDRTTRTGRKALLDAIKAALTDIAAQGKFSCLLLGAEDLKGSDTVRTSTTQISDSSGANRYDVLEVAPELVDAITERLGKQFDFGVGTFSVGIRKVSWEVEGVA